MSDLTQNLLVAAEEIIQAMGGNPPDWLRDEHDKLETAIADFNAAREKAESEKLAEGLLAFAQLGGTIDQLGGNCPVQAEGSIDGQRFYFRARGERWTFTVAPTDAEIFSKSTFHLDRAYGVGTRFAAGWMERSEAVGFMVKAVRVYRADRDLRDAYEAQGSPGTFDEWVVVMANDEKGTLQEAAKVLELLQ